MKPAFLLCGERREYGELFLNSSDGGNFTDEMGSREFADQFLGSIANAEQSNSQHPERQGSPCREILTSFPQTISWQAFSHRRNVFNLTPGAKRSARGG